MMILPLLLIKQSKLNTTFAFQVNWGLI